MSSVRKGLCALKGLIRQNGETRYRTCKAATSHFLAVVRRPMEQLISDPFYFRHKNKLTFE